MRRSAAPGPSWRTRWTGPATTTARPSPSAPPPARCTPVWGIGGVRGIGRPWGQRGGHGWGADEGIAGRGAGRGANWGDERDKLRGWGGLREGWLRGFYEDWGNDSWGVHEAIRGDNRGGKTDGVRGELGRPEEKGRWGSLSPFLRLPRSWWGSPGVLRTLREGVRAGQAAPTFFPPSTWRSGWDGHPRNSQVPSPGAAMGVKCSRECASPKGQGGLSARGVASVGSRAKRLRAVGVTDGHREWGVRRRTAASGSLK